MKLLSLFRRKPESAAEKQALANLDEATQEVAWTEGEKEAEREAATREAGPHMFGHTDVAFHEVPGDPVPEPVDDPDPADDRSLRDVLHEHGDSA